MDAFIKYVVGEMRVIANAPTIFAIALLVLGTAIWWLMDWRYGGVIANKDSEITLIKGQRDAYKENLSGATPDQAKARIDALEARLSKVEPRRLSDTQRADLTSRVRFSGDGARSIEIARDIDCTDCTAIAADIAAVFSAAGWQVTTPKVMGPSNPPPSGIAVRCANVSCPTLEEKTIVDAMRAVGMKVDLQQNHPGGAINFGSRASGLQILLTRAVT